MEIFPVDRIAASLGKHKIKIIRGKTRRRRKCSIISTAADSMLARVDSSLARATKTAEKPGELGTSAHYGFMTIMRFRCIKPEQTVM